MYSATKDKLCNFSEPQHHQATIVFPSWKKSYIYKYIVMQWENYIAMKPWLTMIEQIIMDRWASLLTPVLYFLYCAAI